MQPNDDDVPPTTPAAPEEEAARLAEIAKANEEPFTGDPTLLQRAADRFTPKNTMQAPQLPRRRIKFQVRSADCLPGAFGDKPIVFELVLHSLTSAEELKAMRGCSDLIDTAAMIAKMSMETLNGAPILNEQADLLWELLGPAGRSLVINQYNQIGMISPAGVGKALATSTTS